MGSNGGQQLDEFMTNNGGTPGMYLWNNGGTGGALDLRDRPFVGANDLGNPDRYAWATATRSYLAGHPECNVIIWSWCGQANTTLDNTDIYLGLMEGLMPETYTYRVVAHNEFGVSAASNEASAVISSSVPNAPTDIVSEVNGFDISLTWIDQSTNEESFILERAIDATPFEEYAVLPMNTTEFMDASLPPLHTYAYRVRARSNYGDSDYSNEVSEYIAEESHTIQLKQGVAGYTGCRDSYLDEGNPTLNYGGDAGGEIEWTTPGGTHGPDPIARVLIESSAYYPEFDITGAVQEWVTESRPNFGAILVYIRSSGMVAMIEAARSALVSTSPDSARRNRGRRSSSFGRNRPFVELAQQRGAP